jgi:hypothetical protein
MRRVVVADRAVQPPPSGACSRVQIEGLFLVQRVTTLVINLGSTPPTILTRQGSAPAEWLRTGPQAAPRQRAPQPAGLVLFGGGGLGGFRDFGLVACGNNVPTCSSDDSAGLLTAGVSYWFSPYVAADASFIKPAKLTASGSGDLYRFDSDLDGGIVTLSGQAGAPIGPVKIFGKFGATYHEATFTTTQTVDDSTVIVDDVPQTIPGATQTIQTRTGGWGWLVSGGAEVWFTRMIGVYGEAGMLAVKGSDQSNGEAEIDDRVKFVLAGVRVRVPRFW